MGWVDTSVNGRSCGKVSTSLMVLAVSDSSGTRNVSWAPCPAVVTSGWTVTWAEALIAVPTTTAATNAPTAPARAIRHLADAGRLNKGWEMSVMIVESFEGAQRASPHE